MFKRNGEQEKKKKYCRTNSKLLLQKRDFDFQDQDGDLEKKIWRDVKVLRKSVFEQLENVETFRKD